MNLLTRDATRGPQRRQSVLVLAVAAAALMMAIPALAPASSFGAPVVKKLSPTTGGFIGGTPVIISGSAFVGAIAVDFGSAGATSFIVESQHAIKAVAPPGTGTVDVTVTTPEGTSPTSSADQFSYIASPPAVEGVVPVEAREKGGTQILVKGRNFIGATEVHFGSAPATSFVVNGKGTGITAIDPAAVDKATVDVTVTTPEGTSAITPADRFTYRLLAPIITGLSIHDGPAAGGTTVNISGRSFIEVAAVDFGSASAMSFTVNSNGSITATSPAHTVGKVKVTVTTPAGISGSGECTIFTEEGPERVPCPPHELFVFVEPTVTSVTPNSGPIAGGTTVTITGTGFGVGTGTTVFKFGKTFLATSVDCTSITTCTAVTPAHTAGTVDVRAKVVAAPAVAASRSNPPADQFTYD